MIFPFPYFAPKSSCLSCIQLLIWLRPFSHKLLIEYFSLFWNVLFRLYCLVLSRYLFSLPSFASIFLVGLLKLFFSSSCLSFSNSSVHFLMFRFSILACCRGLFICDSSLSSYPVLDFLRGARFFHRLIFLLRILNRLTPWCRLSGYLSISRSLFQFRLISKYSDKRHHWVVYYHYYYYYSLRAFHISVS